MNVSAGGGSRGGRGGKLPSVPILFNKYNNALEAHNCTIKLPPREISYKVLGGAVALVAREAIARPHPGEPLHDPVAHHLGDDRGGGDREQVGVAVDHRLLAEVEPGHGVDPVDQHQVGLDAQAADRAPHRLEARAADVEAVDRTRAQDRPAERPGPREDPGEDLVALVGFEQLAVGDAVPADVAVEHHRRRHHRPRERPAPRLVHPRHGRGFAREPRFRAREASPAGRHRLSSRRPLPSPSSRRDGQPCQPCDGDRTASRGAPCRA